MSQGAINRNRFSKIKYSQKEIITLYEYDYDKAMKMMDSYDYSRAELETAVFQQFFTTTLISMIPNDYSALQKNQLFKNVISGRQTWKMVKAIHMEDMLESTKELLNLINKELGDKE